jgi:competence protein ComFC
MLNKLKNLIIEAIFPSYCVWCERLGSLVCEECSGKIMRVRGQTCPFCNKIAPKGRACAACQKKHSLKGVLSVGYFKDERLKEIIHVFKYQDLFSLKDYLAGELLELINKEGLVFDTISFVPLSKKRLIRRGYNQSQIIF